jgi:hypothetical protein
MVMRLPRPASPRALWRDMKEFANHRTGHRWIALALALAIPTAIFITFMFDMRNAQDVPPQIIMVDSWPANRSIEETQANIRAVAARRKAIQEERQRQFQVLQNGMDRLGI